MEIKVYGDADAVGYFSAWLASEYLGALEAEVAHDAPPVRQDGRLNIWCTTSHPAHPMNALDALTPEEYATLEQLHPDGTVDVVVGVRPGRDGASPGAAERRSGDRVAWFCLRSDDGTRQATLNGVRVSTVEPR